MEEIRGLVNVLHPKWTVEILLTLAEGPLRYSDLQCKLTLASHEKVHNPVFTAALAHMQEEGLVAHDNDERHSYRLTIDGIELVEGLGKVADWRRRHPAHSYR
jgi:DNA-binding HxlR family transcriptional regulator